MTPLYVVYSVVRGEGAIFVAPGGKLHLEGAGLVDFTQPVRLDPSDCIWIVPGTLTC